MLKGNSSSSKFSFPIEINILQSLQYMASLILKYVPLKKDVTSIIGNTIKNKEKVEQHEGRYCPHCAILHSIRSKLETTETVFYLLWNQFPEIRLNPTLSEDDIWKRFVLLEQSNDILQKDVLIHHLLINFRTNSKFFKKSEQYWSNKCYKVRGINIQNP